MNPHKISFRISRGTAALGLFVIGLASIVVAAQRPASAQSLALATNKFLDSLTPDQRKQAMFAIDSDEFTRWHFIPTTSFPRNGLPIKSMTEPQREAARGLLRAALSQRGFVTATSIMDLELVLKALEGAGGTMVRDPELYYFSVFGTPSEKSAWGFRVEGHHLSLHFTMSGGSVVASSPAFFGVNPAEVRDGPKKGLRILGADEDSARALVQALTDEQRKAAIINTTAPNDIVTMTTVKIDPLSPVGILASAMTAPQRDMLMKIIDGYASKMADDVAADRLAKIRQAGLEKIAFAWAGETERGKKHYYRVQGPTFLIEFDNTQNDGNHIHSVWRDFNGDFGRDLLREHIKSVPHQ